MPTKTLRSDEKCEQLIELVRNNPVIYDTRHPDYKVALVMKRTWSAIARTLQIDGISGEEVKIRWQTLRDTYVRKKREIASNTTPSEPIRAAYWKYMDTLCFLDTFMRKSRTDDHIKTENISYEKQCSSENSQNEDTDLRIIDGEHKGSSESKYLNAVSSCKDQPKAQVAKGSVINSSKCLKPMHHKKRKYDNKFESEPSIQQTQIYNVDAQWQNKRKRDATDAFFESCAIRSKQLTRHNQAWLQMKVSALLYQAEYSDNRYTTTSPHLPKYRTQKAPQTMATLPPPERAAPPATKHTDILMAYESTVRDVISPRTVIETEMPSSGKAKHMDAPLVCESTDKYLTSIRAAYDTANTASDSDAASERTSTETENVNSYINVAPTKAATNMDEQLAFAAKAMDLTLARTATDTDDQLASATSAGAEQLKCIDCT